MHRNTVKRVDEVAFKNEYNYGTSSRMKILFSEPKVFRTNGPHIGIGTTADLQCFIPKTVIVRW